MSLASVACASIAMACDDWSLGYSQPNRLSIWDGGEADCSSLVAWAYNRGGARPRFPSSTWTGSIRAEAAARDFTVLPWSRGMGLVAGDALLSEMASGGVGHVALFTGGDALREAWINEVGQIVGGRSGDQTGGETRTVSYASHPYTTSARWTHVLRPPSTPTTTATAATITQEDSDMTPDQATQLANVAYLVNGPIADAVGRIEQRTYATQAQVTAMGAAVEALSTAQGLDPDAVRAAIDKAVSEALAGMSVTLTAEAGGK